MRKLSREYGWSALGVYLLLTALDFPFCFLAVKLLGTDRIGHWEHVALSWIKGVIKWPLGEEQREVVDGVSREVKDAVGLTEIEAGEKRLLEERAEKRVLEVNEGGEVFEGVEDHGYKEAEKANRGDSASRCCCFAFASRC